MRVEEQAPVRRPRSRRRRSPLWSVWNIASTVVLGTVSVFAFVAVVLPLLLGAETYTVLTGSMKPGMPPGTLVGVRPTPIDDIQIGDIITYQMESNKPAVITHRVIGMGLDGKGDTILRTQGDDNNAPDDEPVIGPQVRGVAVYAVPYLGYPSSVLGGETRSILVVLLGAGIILYGLTVVGADVRQAQRERTKASAASGPTKAARPVSSRMSFHRAS